MRLSLVTLLALVSAPTALAGSSCIAFDTAWNLLAFGFNGKDYNAGTSNTWASGSATDITTNGRPPFNGNDVKCYLAEFFNAIYIIGADTSKPADIYIYDAGAKTWSTQSVTAGDFDPTSFQAILDHDTNVFYALSKGNLFSLEMNELKAAKSGSIAWAPQGKAEITTDNYDPVMAVAQNHVFFFGVPGTPAGSTPIFVIHFAFWQAGAQPMGGNFPDSHGQATSIFLDVGVQQEIAFIPDDGSKTYIVNVETNTTQTMSGPATVDAKARYFASPTAIVQLASSGAVSWIPYKAGDNSANSGAKWSAVSNLAAVAPSSGGGSAPSGSAPSQSSKTAGSGGSAAPSGSKTAGGSGPSGSASGAIRHAGWGAGSVLGLVAVAFFLL
ncbi:hypothetical protein MIND_00605300 [Mycena indigotica]|uniref:Uncharacterized protein n=1 Tax=Mycena indigotica TaxID=2126181 RepID=A0A8H6SRV7_9AGAR|nr:uncharacterized protein MIND_00605300 [Mycena indigotica]KAF7303757.1 hypothetical protein MIND_00605300 [Mycena indigotica]